MENKTILITGGSSGVGTMLVDELSKSNKIITIARRLEKLHRLFSNNINVETYQVDISNLESVKTFLNVMSEQGIVVDGIINCAGVMQRGDIDDISIDDYTYSINVNAIAPLMIVKHFLPIMKSQNYGRIINITSGAPLNCFQGFSLYSSSKALLNAWTVTLSKELKELNIKINLMSPGPVKTEMAPNATMDPLVCLPTVKYLLDNVTTGGDFYWLGYKVPLFPDLKGVDWLNGVGNDKLIKVL